MPEEKGIAVISVRHYLVSCLEAAWKEIYLMPRNLPGVFDSERHSDNFLVQAVSDLGIVRP